MKLVDVVAGALVIVGAFGLTAVVYGLVGAAGLSRALFWKRVQGRWIQAATHHA